MAIKLGSKVRDSITGFEGVAVSVVTFLYGCTRIGIEPEKLDDKGTPIEMQYFDEQRVEVVKEQKAPVSGESTSTTGGPHDAPQRHADPSMSHRRF